MSFDVRPSGDSRDQTAAHAPSIGRSLCFFRGRSTLDNDPNAIRDARFWNQLTNLASLKALLLTRGVHIREEDIPLLSFGMLNDLRYDEKGRLPTIEEWEQLDKRSQKLFTYLGDELRKHFELSQTANLIAQLPLLLIFVALLVVAILSLIAVIFEIDRLLLLGCYFLWTALLGAIGAIAYLSMNTLSIQKDITFDFTNKSLLAVRIVLGALFGFFLSMPFGVYSSFITFWGSLAHGTPGTGAANFSLEAALLLLPFVLGFSTSLVILVLNRFVESITVFLGSRPGSNGSS
jgi:hypothetical protein